MRYIILFLLLAVGHAFSQISGTNLESPNGLLNISFRTLGRDEAPSVAGRLVYDLSFRDKRIILPSGLSLTLQDRKPLGSDVRIVKATVSTMDETYRLIAGKSNPVRNHCNTLLLDTIEDGPPGRRLLIEARAYDDAVAFRYVVPDQPSLKEFRLSAETTEFRVSKDAMTYALVLPNFQTQYENEFTKLPVSAFSFRGGVLAPPLIGLPILLELPGVAWLAITEANLKDYAGMYLLNPATNWPERWFESRLAPHTNDPNLCVTGQLPHNTPWRVLMVADDPGRFIESTVIKSLNPETDIRDTSWIHPGKSGWDWWSGDIGPDGKSAMNDATMRYYVDFAAQSGFPYMLVDAGWSPRGDITRMNGDVDIPGLVRYAAPKGVKIWVWAHWTAVAKQMKEAFPQFQNWGVAGVKIDFMSRDDQEMINFYHAVAELAAKHHLMVDFHGACKPTGMERTWPNVLGYEGVLGMEYSKATGRDNPDHHLMLPFTRMLAGTMDYTPGGFGNVTREEFEPRMQKPMVQCTRAHQLAMYVVYECPIQMVSDWPGAYAGQPEFQFIKDAPATWDETRALNGAPGQYITVARRSGNDWFLGSMCDWTPRQIDVPLTFLGKGEYTATIYADGKDADKQPRHVTIETRAVKAGGNLTLHLTPGGGCAARFAPVK